MDLVSLIHNYTCFHHLIFILELAIIASCILTPVAMGLISSIGTIEQEFSVPDEDEKKPSKIVKEKVFYFRGY